MICTNCKSERSKVIETGREGEVILRRRECKECGERYNTREAICHGRGSRSKYTPTRKTRDVKLVTKQEAREHRTSVNKRRRDAEDLKEYYTDEYVESMVSDDEIKDLLELFGECA